MGDWVVKVLAWFGKPALFLAAALLFCGVSLWCSQYHWFAPANKMLEPYRGWLQIGLVASSICLGVLGSTKLGSVFIRSVQRRKMKKQRIKQVHHLTVEEQQVLGAYIRRRSRTVNWPLDYGVIHSLVTRGMLYRTVNNADFRSYPHDIPEDLWDYLNAHPELVTEAGESDHEPGKRGWMSF